MTSDVGHRPRAVGTDGSAILDRIADLRWREPRLAAELAQQALADAAERGDAGTWLRAAGWLLYGRAAIGDARDVALELLGDLDTSAGHDVLRRPEAARLRVELAALAQANGDPGIALDLLEGWEPADPDSAADELELDRLAVLVRCALVDEAEELVELRADVEAISLRLDGAPAALAELLLGSVHRDDGEPAAAAERALRGLARLGWTPADPTSAPSSPHLGCALLSQWATALLEDGSASDIPDGVKQLSVVDGGRHGVLWQLAVARAFAGRARPTAEVLEDAASGAAAVDAPSLEAACRSAQAELYEGAGRFQDALVAVRAATEAERVDRDRAERLREALSGPAAALVSALNGDDEVVDPGPSLSAADDLLAAMSVAVDRPGAVGENGFSDIASQPGTGAAGPAMVTLDLGIDDLDGGPHVDGSADAATPAGEDDGAVTGRAGAAGVSDEVGGSGTVTGDLSGPVVSDVVDSSARPSTVGGPERNGGSAATDSASQLPGSVGADDSADDDEGSPLADALIEELRKPLIEMSRAAASLLRGSRSAHADGAAETDDGGLRATGTDVDAGSDDGSDVDGRSGEHGPTGVNDTSETGVAGCGDGAGLNAREGANDTREGADDARHGANDARAGAHGAGRSGPSGGGDLNGPARPVGAGGSARAAGPVAPAAPGVASTPGDSAGPDGRLVPGDTVGPDGAGAGETSGTGAAADGVPVGAADPRGSLVIVLELVDAAGGAVRHPDVRDVADDLTTRAARLVPPAAEVDGPDAERSVHGSLVQVSVPGAEGVAALLWARSLVGHLASRIPRRNLPDGTVLRARVHGTAGPVGEAEERVLDGPAGTGEPSSPAGAETGSRQGTVSRLDVRPGSGGRRRRSAGGSGEPGTPRSDRQPRTSATNGAPVAGLRSGPDAGPDSDDGGTGSGHGAARPERGRHGGGTDGRTGARGADGGGGGGGTDAVDIDTGGSGGTDDGIVSTDSGDQVSGGRRARRRRAQADEAAQVGRTATASAVNGHAVSDRAGRGSPAADTASDDGGGSAPAAHDPVIQHPAPQASGWQDPGVQVSDSQDVGADAPASDDPVTPPVPEGAVRNGRRSRPTTLRAVDPLVDDTDGDVMGSGRRAGDGAASGRRAGDDTASDRRAGDDTASGRRAADDVPSGRRAGAEAASGRRAGDDTAPGRPTSDDTAPDRRASDDAASDRRSGGDETLGPRLSEDARGAGDGGASALDRAAPGADGVASTSPAPGPGSADEPASGAGPSGPPDPLDTSVPVGDVVPQPSVWLLPESVADAVPDAEDRDGPRAGAGDTGEEPSGLTGPDRLDLVLDGPAQHEVEAAGTAPSGAGVDEVRADRVARHSARRNATAANGRASANGSAVADDSRAADNSSGRAPGSVSEVRDGADRDVQAEGRDGRDTAPRHRAAVAGSDRAVPDRATGAPRPGERSADGRAVADRAAGAPGPGKQPAEGHAVADRAAGAAEPGEQAAGGRAVADRAAGGREPGEQVVEDPAAAARAAGEPAPGQQEVEQPRPDTEADGRGTGPGDPTGTARPEGSAGSARRDRRSRTERRSARAGRGRDAPATGGDPTAIPDDLGLGDLLAGALAAYRDI